LQLYHSVLDGMIDCKHVSLYDIKHACLELKFLCTQPSSNIMPCINYDQRSA
jgi:hypothetical protein